MTLHTWGIGTDRGLSCHKKFNPLKYVLGGNEQAEVSIFYTFQAADPFNLKFPKSNSRIR